MKQCAHGKLYQFIQRQKVLKRPASTSHCSAGASSREEPQKGERKGNTRHETRTESRAHHCKYTVKISW